MKLSSRTQPEINNRNHDGVAVTEVKGQSIHTGQVRRPGQSSGFCTLSSSIKQTCARRK